MGAGERIRSWLKFLDQNLLLLLSLFLLSFIPLFPKIPLFDALPGYSVRIRPEDILIALTGLVWLRDVARKRAAWNPDFLALALLFAVSGAVSIGLATFLLRSIPLEVIHIGKSALHYFRYLEYFSLFFFVSAVIKKRTQVWWALFIIGMTLMGVVAYGFGQKFWHLPVFSTMNREFSKGELLYLQDGARPQSTFAGHYDLGAYLVVVLPVLFAASLALLSKTKTLKRMTAFVFLQACHWSGLTMLVLSGAKTSLLAYGIAIAVVVILSIRRLQNSHLKLAVGTGALLAAIAVSSLLWIFLPATTRGAYLSQLSIIGRSRTAAPPDYQGVPKDGNVWSENALKYGQSIGIRLDTLWPQALLGFVNNPLTGNGFGTLAMLGTGRFVETDSTDNNFLRTLGESGIVGFVVFYSTILWLMRRSVHSLLARDPLVYALAAGFIGSITGLLVNAVYIDVFAASKVAFTFWGLAGLIDQFGALNVKKRVPTIVPGLAGLLKKFWPLIAVLVLAFFFLHQNPYAEHSRTQDINNFPASLESLAATRCYNKLGAMAICRSDGQVVSQYKSAYSTLLAPLLRLFPIHGAFYFLNISLVILALILTYVWLRRVKTHPLIQFALLAVMILGLAVTRFTQRPLTEALFWAIVASPVVILFAAKLITRFRRIHILATTVFLLTVVMTSGIIPDLPRRFSNAEPIPSKQALQVADAFAAGLDGGKFMAMSLHPLFIDEFSRQRFTALPLNPAQLQEDTPELWKEGGLADLDGEFDRLLSDDQSVFLSDFGLDNSRFTELKAKFDPRYRKLGCGESCNILQLLPESAESSPSPLNILGAAQSLVAVPADYEFSVVNNRFDGRFLQPQQTYNTVVFSSYVQASGHLDTDFLIITGDYVSAPDGGQETYFHQTVIPMARKPILYNAGNYDLIPKKLHQVGYQSFFIGSEYFIILDAEGQQVNEAQRIGLYNSALELEELPQIKNVFVVAHDLNWQDKASHGEGITTIEQVLVPFTKLKKFFFTMNHNPRAAQAPSWFESMEDQGTGSYYFAGLVSDGRRDASFRVSISSEGAVSVAASR